MNSDWASENLQVIRTLMERSIMYRRALAPMTMMAGVLGLIAAAGGWFAKLDDAAVFIAYWVAAAGVINVAALLLARKQSLNDKEAFWSSPTRRVALAAAPGFIGAGMVTLAVALRSAHSSEVIPWLITIWVLFYGCALCAAGFFMPRGIKLFGWLYLVLAAVMLFVLWPYWLKFSVRENHLVMGAVFGGVHLAYGIYLHFTEKRGNAS
ncbi:MAG: hypothetical protein K0Q55_861 [Verrucomicrobia bacterium]|jgi:hypothetical protein|nr:hypothetical protein [Verrucomicrobiota bacterium]